MQGRIVNYFVHHTQTLGQRTALPSSSNAAGAMGSSSVSAFSSPTLQPAPAPPTASKKEKALTSLFGGGDTDDDEEEEEEDGSESDISDCGFEKITAPASSEEPEQLVSFGSAPASVLLPSVASALPLEEDATSCTAPACSSNDWQRILERAHKVYTIFGQSFDAFADVLCLRSVLTASPTLLLRLFLAHRHARPRRQLSYDHLRTDWNQLPGLLLHRCLV